MVVFDGEEVAGSFVLNDVPGAFALGVERIVRDDGAIVRKGCKEVEFVFMGLIGTGTAYGFAIDRNGLGAGALKFPQRLADDPGEFVADLIEQFPKGTRTGGRHRDHCDVPSIEESGAAAG